MAQQNVFLLRLRVMREMAADTDSVISAVTAELPVGFPEHISILGKASSFIPTGNEILSSAQA